MDTRWDTANCWSVCLPCHNFIHDHGEKALLARYPRLYELQRTRAILERELLG